MSEAPASMPIMRRIYLSLYVRARFLVLARRHREAVSEAAYLGAHLEEDVFPGLQDQGVESVVLDCTEEALVLREHRREPARILPNTQKLSATLRAVPVDSVRLSARLESNQVVEAILTLLHVQDRLQDAPPEPGPIPDTWAPGVLAGLMKGGAGFHKFCALMRYRVDERRYEVDYAYCELFFTHVVNIFVNRFGRARDHRALFAAAPWAGVLVGAVLLLWSALGMTAPYAGFGGGVVLSLLMGIGTWYAVFTLGSVQYDREHRDALLRDANRNLEERVRARTEELQLTQDVTFQSLAALAETRDPETGAHLERTRLYVKALAADRRADPRHRDALDEATVDLLYRSAPLHDIGKVGVPDQILLKPGKLTAEEFEEMKRHTLYGNEALRWAEERLGRSSFLALAREIALTHHEKWDGSGYPHGLAGDAIPLSGRLMALADVYDALISKRVYKEAFSHEKAKGIILEGRGNHFDPEVVDSFKRVEEAFVRIAQENADVDNGKEKQE